MESIERLQNALKGERVDRPPFSFWQHFGLQHMSGESVATAHIAFARRFNLDFVKVMSDYPFPVREGMSLDRMTDILQLQVLHGNEGGWSHQLLALKNIHSALGKEKWIVDTVYSPWTHLCRLFGTETMLKMIASRPELVRQGLEVVTASLVNYVNEARPYINGIYFSISEADYSQLDPIEHGQRCFPFNSRIFEAAAGLPFNIVRLKGHRAYFESVKEYPSAAASWEHFRTKTGLAKGLVAWNRAILGGIDGDGVHLRSTAAVKQMFEKYAPEYLLQKLIVAPTRSLRTNVSPYLLEAIAAGVESLAKFNPGKPSSARELSRCPSMESELGAAYRNEEKLERVSREEREAARAAIAEQSRKNTDLEALVRANQESVSDAAPSVEDALPSGGFAGEPVDAKSVESQEVEPEDIELPADVELEDIDDIFADDFEEYDEEEQEESGDSAPVADADKPRQAWKQPRGERGGTSRRHENRGEDRGRERRGGYNRHEGRSGAGSRERRGGYGSREQRGNSENGERRGGYGNRDYGTRRDSREDGRNCGTGYGRDERRSYGEREERRGGYGRRNSRDDASNYGNRGGNRRNGSYGERQGGVGGNRRGYGERSGRTDRYGSERHGGYNGTAERGGDSGRRVIRIKR